MKLQRSHHRILSETAQRIFEEAAFALADPPESGGVELRTEENRVSCAVEFFGPFSGVLAVVTDCRLARTVAANMLGLEDCNVDAAEKSTDALGEIVNMICGNLLPEMAGGDIEFSIKAPEEIPTDAVLRLIEGHPDESTLFTRLFIEGSRTDVALLMSEIATGR